jgi:hypothetical protein
VPSSRRRLSIFFSWGSKYDSFREIFSRRKWMFSSVLCLIPHLGQKERFREFTKAIFCLLLGKLCCFSLTESFDFCPPMVLDANLWLFSRVNRTDSIIVFQWSLSGDFRPASGHVSSSSVILEVREKDLEVFKIGRSLLSDMPFDEWSGVVGRW